MYRKSRTSQRHSANKKWTRHEIEPIERAELVRDTTERESVNDSTGQELEQREDGTDLSQQEVD